MKISAGSRIFSSFVVPAPGMGVSLIPGNAKNLSIAACEPFFTGYAKLSTYVNSNNMPLNLFGYILKRPDGESDGQNPQSRTSQYCNNQGSLIFPFDLRKPGRYRIEFLLRERDGNAWEKSSWAPIGGIDFTLTE